MERDQAIRLMQDLPPAHGGKEGSICSSPRDFPPAIKVDGGNPPQSIDRFEARSRARAWSAPS